VSNVGNMDYMFMDNTSFNQDLSNWNVYFVTGCMGFNKINSTNQNSINWTLPKPNFTNCNPD
jgi:hypothetical protein